MNLPEKISSIQLEHHLNTEELRLQLVEQLCKDLELEPLNVAAGSSAFFKELANEVVGVMRYKVEKQAQTIPNLIYRVDLNEMKVKQLLANPELDAAESLAKEIILREMKKVFYRNVYSGKIKV